MLIKQCSGFELEKTLKNTFEDFYNQSEVTFVENGEEKTFRVLYLRYFDEQISSFTPFDEDPIFTIQSKEVYFRDIVALACLLTNPGYRHRKRVFINELREFEQHFKGLQFNRLQEIMTHLTQNKDYEIKSPLEFIEHM